MQVGIQIYTKRGFYGPSIEKSMRTVAELPKVLAEVFDETPDQCEDQKFLDWTKIEVEIRR
jgi:hypothetical protein